MKNIKEYLEDVLNEGLFGSKKKTFNDLSKEFKALAQKTLDSLHIEATVSGFQSTKEPNKEGIYFMQLELFGKWPDKYLKAIHSKEHEVYYPVYATEKKINKIKDICDDKAKKAIEEAITKNMPEWIKKCEKNFK